MLTVKHELSQARAYKGKQERRGWISESFVREECFGILMKFQACSSISASRLRIPATGLAKEIHSL